MNNKEREIKVGPKPGTQEEVIISQQVYSVRIKISETESVTYPKNKTAQYSETIGLILDIEDHLEEGQALINSIHPYKESSDSWEGNHQSIETSVTYTYGASLEFLTQIELYASALNSQISREWLKLTKKYKNIPEVAEYLQTVNTVLDINTNLLEQKSRYPYQFADSVFSPMFVKMKKKGLKSDDINTIITLYNERCFFFHILDLITNKKLVYVFPNNLSAPENIALLKELRALVSVQPFFKRGYSIGDELQSVEPSFLTQGYTILNKLITSGERQSDSDVISTLGFATVNTVAYKSFDFAAEHKAYKSSEIKNWLEKGLPIAQYIKHLWLHMPLVLANPDHPAHNAAATFFSSCNRINAYSSESFNLFTAFAQWIKRMDVETGLYDPIVLGRQYISEKNTPEVREVGKTLLFEIFVGEAQYPVVPDNFHQLKEKADVSMWDKEGNIVTNTYSLLTSIPGVNPEDFLPESSMTIAQMVEMISRAPVTPNLNNVTEARTVTTAELLNLNNANISLETTASYEAATAKASIQCHFKFIQPSLTQILRFSIESDANSTQPVATFPWTQASTSPGEHFLEKTLTGLTVLHLMITHWFYRQANPRLYEENTESNREKENLLNGQENNGKEKRKNGNGKKANTGENDDTKPDKKDLSNSVETAFARLPKKLLLDPLAIKDLNNFDKKTRDAINFFIINYNKKKINPETIDTVKLVREGYLRLKVSGQSLPKIRFIYYLDENNNAKIERIRYRDEKTYLGYM